MSRIVVPGAEAQKAACLTDLTTAGTVPSGHSFTADFSGLHTAATVNPTGVPGIQIDGYFPDTSTTNTRNGWNHDSQFVLRLPDNWNGGLVIAPPPGNRTQYSSDFIISDYVLAKGYAYASTDKGNTGVDFYKDGKRPGDAVAEWNHRITQLTVAAKLAVWQRYAKPAKTTLLFGISNGGYLVRWQLENRAFLYDGGIDWEGSLFTPTNNLNTYLPTALRNYPAYAAGDPAAEQAILDAGFADGSQFLWPFHYSFYWDLTQRVYREEFDPGFDGDLQAGIPFCAPGTPNCDADYDLASRPKAVKKAIARVSLTGKIKTPLITLHGTLDTLLPISIDSDAYAKMIADKGRAGLHRYYRITDGNHVDGLYPTFPQLRPMLPCARTAFDSLVGWVHKGKRPPASKTIANPGTDVVNSCSLG